jgi:hypothetical protein
MRSRSSDMIECHILNYIWLGQAGEPGQKRGKNSSTKREAGFAATVSVPRQFVQYSLEQGAL